MRFFNLKIHSIMKIKKTQSPDNLPAKTYKLGRVCLYCGEPIED
jgi:hypothetical protein